MNESIVSFICSEERKNMLYKCIIDAENCEFNTYGYCNNVEDCTHAKPTNKNKEENGKSKLGEG